MSGDRASDGRSDHGRPQVGRTGARSSGVAPVLVGDLAAAGALVVHRTADVAGPDLDLMDRVLRGLRDL